MKPDPHPSDVLRSQDVADLPPKCKWFGYAAVAASLVFLHPVFLAVAHADSASAFFQYLWFSGNWVRNTGLIALAIFILLVVLSIYAKIAYHQWKRSHDFFGALLVLIVLHAVLAN